MKKIVAAILALLMLLALASAEQSAETVITLGETITVNGEAIAEDASSPVYLTHVVETHEDVLAELAGVSNRVVTITDGGVYRITGTAADTQIAVRAGSEDDVRIILDGVALTCRTNAAIAVYSARDPRAAGEYGVTIELAEGSENVVTGSHNSAATDEEPEFDGAIGSQVSLGFEGTGALTVEADKEGVEVACGHLTINGGVIRIVADDDPLNVSEDGVGVLTMNDGYVYSAVRNVAGCEGDGIDSNGWIVFNGGTAINLAHPSSQDGGIDSDMGSTINGGVIVGAGNMYDPIESDSAQLFMMLEFSESTDDLVVVTDAAGKPVFAYDFPYDYMYIAFSTPDLVEGETYHVYLGGEIEGAQEDGLYTTITAYTPGRQLVHGAGVAEQRAVQMPSDMGGQMGGEPGSFDPMQGGQIPDMGGQMGGMQTPDMTGQAPDTGDEAVVLVPDMDGQTGGMQTPPDMGGQMGGEPGSFDPMQGGMGGGMQQYAALYATYQTIDLNEVLAGVDLNERLMGKDLNGLRDGFLLTEILTEDELRAIFGEDVDLEALAQMETMLHSGFGGMGGGMGAAPRAMESSADVATGDFVLTRESCTFSNLTVK